MLADELDVGVVIGVDIHKHTHTAAAVSGTGAVLAHLTVPANPKAIGSCSPSAVGRAALWAIEGTGVLTAGTYAFG